MACNSRAQLSGVNFLLGGSSKSKAHHFPVNRVRCMPSLGIIRFYLIGDFLESMPFAEYLVDRAVVR